MSLLTSKSPNVILGFYTLAACEIHANKLPRKYAKKFPSKIPAAKLARLAVSKRRQRQGIGSLMMIDAMKRVLTVLEQLGVHPRVAKPITVSGKIGADALHYLEKDVKKAIEDSKK